MLTYEKQLEWELNLTVGIKVLRPHTLVAGGLIH
jgi:hypothetical protein